MYTASAKRAKKCDNDNVTVWALPRSTLVRVGIAHVRSSIYVAHPTSDSQFSAVLPLSSHRYSYEAPIFWASRKSSTMQCRPFPVNQIYIHPRGHGTLNVTSSKRDEDCYDALLHCIRMRMRQFRTQPLAQYLRWSS
jgi:hypothetical protein